MGSVGWHIVCTVCHVCNSIYNEDIVLKLTILMQEPEQTITWPLDVPVVSLVWQRKFGKFND